MLTYLLSYTVSKLWLMIHQIFDSNRGCFTLKPSLGVISCEYPDKLTSSETRMIVLPDAENRTIVSSFLWTNTGM